jgi:argininosuccinate synthase
MSRKVSRVCLAYSGGLDTSVILHWLIERYGCEVVAYTADVGQEEELSGLPRKAKETGAIWALKYLRTKISSCLPAGRVANILCLRLYFFNSPAYCWSFS